MDYKENFHMTLGTITTLLGLESSLKIKGAIKGPEASKFLSAGFSLLNELVPAVQVVVTDLEQHLGIKGFKEEVMRGQQRWVLRCLHYPKCEKGTILATPHVDKSGLTLYLGSTTAGVQYYDRSLRRWIDISLERSSVTLTANMQMQYLRHDIKGLWHQVVANYTAGRKGRDSVVLFIPFVHVPPVDKARIGRMQNQPVGFNYNMEEEEFRRLFKE